MVSGIGSAAFKDPIGTAAFMRAFRLGFGLAHSGDGFCRHHGHEVPVKMVEVAVSLAGACLMG
jgi:hypothetical protein